jgi:methylated-DNA-protein-cysteine methyltransferase-like protein
MDLEQKIIAAIRRIPRGRVATYGAIAALAGAPRRARLVGTVLKRAPASLKLPWHRVINAQGRSSFPAGSDAHQRQLAQLQRERVKVVGGRIDLERFGWPETRALDELLWKLD